MTSTVNETFQALARRAEMALAQRTNGHNILIQVGSATCEHAAGSLDVADEFRKHIAASQRTDIQLRQTGCTGRCSREPIVGVFIPGQMPIKYERVNRELVHEIFTAHVLKGQPVLAKVLDGPIEKLAHYELLICGSTRCGWRGQKLARGPLAEKLKAAGLGPEQVRVTAASCFGACSNETAGKCTHILVRPDKVLYRVTTEDDLEEIIRSHLVHGNVVQRLRVAEQPVSQQFFEIYGDVAFFNRQNRIALRHNGVIDPESIEEYFHYKGFEALAEVLGAAIRQWVIDEVTRSKLRGRGGGGFPTGQKWAMGAAAEETRYLICNADEGDPGAFMDRSMLEWDPFNVVEGMLIAGYRHRRPARVLLRAGRISPGHPPHRERHRPVPPVRAAGQEHPGLGLRFRPGNPPGGRGLRVRRGDGADPLHRGRARAAARSGPLPHRKRPVGQAHRDQQRGDLRQRAGGHPVRRRLVQPHRHANSGGTKVFALAGKVTHTGLVEVPMGTTLREVV